MNKVIREVLIEEAKFKRADSHNLALLAYVGGIDREKVSFEKYLESVGLAEKAELTKNITKEEAIAKADRILAAIREQRE